MYARVGHNEKAEELKLFSCTSCMACVNACPIHLLPNELSVLSEAKRWDLIGDADIADCIDDGQRFTPEKPCDEIEPTCGVVLGACCFADGSPCIGNSLREDCELAGGKWSEGGS